jgi:hypothetical protein
MKVIALILAILAMGIASFAQTRNEIDDLKTAADVNAFLNKLKPELAKEAGLDTKAAAPSGFGKNTFHKVDINNDGATDLIVDAKRLLAFLWKANGKAEIIPLDGGIFIVYRYSLASVAKKDAETLLTIRLVMAPGMPEQDIYVEKTLVYKFGGFLEYNAKPDDLKVEKILFSTSGCYGTCPVFDMEIDKDGKAAYNAKHYNDLQDGKFSGTIGSPVYAKIVQNINYIGLQDLKPEYSVPWTDDQTATLTITYNGGKKKTISDYGMIGTFGLKLLYGQLSDLRGTVDWTKLK